MGLLADKDLKRAACAAIEQQGPSASISVERYVLLLRRENKHELADTWEQVARWIDALRPRSLH
jgi:hypothetical protein